MLKNSSTLNHRYQSGYRRLNFILNPNVKYMTAKPSNSRVYRKKLHISVVKLFALSGNKCAIPH